MGCGASTAKVAPGEPAPKAPDASPEPAPPVEAAPPVRVASPAKQEPTPAKAEPAQPPQTAAQPKKTTCSSKTLPERIRTEELIKLCQSSHFDRTQVESLYELFKVISSSGDDDGLIDKAEFQRALGLKKNLFVDRMFELFDSNNDQSINFTEFIAGLSCFTTRAKPAEKCRFSFKMYDFNGDDVIDKQELTRMLHATIEDNKIKILPEDASRLIDATFEECQCATPGQITFEEYGALVAKKPHLLEFMTIQSLSSLIG